MCSPSFTAICSKPATLLPCKRRHPVIAGVASSTKPIQASETNGVHGIF